MLSGAEENSPLKRNVTIAYSIENDVQPFVDELSSGFRLRNYVTNDTEYMLLTTLPTADALNALQILNEITQERIFNALKQIYSHVTERTPSEGADHFFIHVAATVYYEEHTGISIKGKEHYKKAASLVKMLERVVEDNLAMLNPKYLERGLVTPEQAELIERFNKVLEAHLNATNRALQIISFDKKQHLKTYQHQDVDHKPATVMSPQKLAAVESTHPSATFNKTPKKLSQSDKDSIGAISAAMRKLSFDEDDQTPVVIPTIAKPKQVSDKKKSSLKPPSSTLYFFETPANIDFSNPFANGSEDDFSSSEAEPQDVWSEDEQDFSDDEQWLSRSPQISDNPATLLMSFNTNKPESSTVELSRPSTIMGEPELTDEPESKEGKIKLQ